MKIAGFGRMAVAAAAFCGMGSAALAQDAADTVDATAEAVGVAVVEPVAPAPAGRGSVIPKLTPVFLELLDEVSSATATTGDTFRLKLVTPIAVGDRVVVQAGAEGVGEVVHAKKKGGSGAGGELLLAARYLTLADGRQLPLRSMQMMATGKDEDGKVQVMTGLVGAFGMLVKGRDTIIAPGRMAQAKVKEDFPVEVPVAQPAQEVAQVSDSIGGGMMDAPEGETLQGVE
ncbi:hypothetical protein K3172_05950 [Qipengyuania sp. 6B39]|uniref:hypothetical protein n=1 Tax=Qipengyuania proteolytica TaxID=2867239 RepID=UPI001C89DDF1|nr:hypothetical protein [Qipengyuania proteolytica]MBX7495396.1 hypothetical protein [Qipengyuania proteolytica]